MRKLALASGLILVLAISLLVFTKALSHPAPQQTTTRHATTTKVLAPNRTELLALVNAERAKNGIAPLTEDSRLDTSAQLKADDEVANHYFGHINPVTGKDYSEYLNPTGIVCSYTSENITENIHTNDSKTAVNAWIASPPHHQAMIDPRYSLTGFGISGDQLVEHFCQTP